MHYLTEGLVLKGHIELYEWFFSYPTGIDYDAD
jgi:hypothetical protein